MMSQDRAGQTTRAAPVRRWAGVCVAAFATVAACGLADLDHIAPAEPPATPVPTAAGPLALPSGLPEEEFRDAERFRRGFGLRSDPAWIIALAGDPTADRVTFGVPVTFAERDELLARASNADEVEDVIAEYGASQPDYAGLYLDQLDRGTVVALFTGRLAEHAAAIGRLVGPGTNWEVRPVRWSRLELERHWSRVKGDTGWLEDIGATYDGGGIDTSENEVELRISSANPDAPRLIIEHFDAEEWLRVKSDGVGPWRGGYGRLEITVVAADGTPVEDASCDPVPDVSSAYSSGDMGWGTSEAGICSFPVGATGYTVHISVDGPTGPVEVGSGRVTVPVDGVGRIRIVVTEP